MPQTEYQAAWYEKNKAQLSKKNQVRYKENRDILHMGYRRGTRVAELLKDDDKTA